jgi:hypothetical protein
MFRQLADPDGANNALSQVLYGLALRYSPTTLPSCAYRFCNAYLSMEGYKGLPVCLIQKSV